MIVIKCDPPLVVSDTAAIEPEMGFKREVTLKPTALVFIHLRRYRITPL
jgi:hypothetical protein